MIEEKCIRRIEREVLVMRGESHLNFGDMTVDFVKAENTVDRQGIYDVCIKLKNKLGEIFYQDDQQIDVDGKDWDYYKEFLYEVVMKYMDIDEPALKTYFREKFLYE